MAKIIAICAQPRNTRTHTKQVRNDTSSVAGENAFSLNTLQLQYTLTSIVVMTRPDKINIYQVSRYISNHVMSAPSIAIRAQVLIDPNSQSLEEDHLRIDIFLCFPISLSIPMSAPSTPESRNPIKIFCKVDISIDLYLKSM